MCFFYDYIFYFSFVWLNFFNEWIDSFIHSNCKNTVTKTCLLRSISINFMFINPSSCNLVFIWTLCWELHLKWENICGFTWQASWWKQSWCAFVSEWTTGMIETQLELIVSRASRTIKTLADIYISLKIDSAGGGVCLQSDWQLRGRSPSAVWEQNKNTKSRTWVADIQKILRWSDEFRDGDGSSVLLRSLCFGSLWKRSLTCSCFKCWPVRTGRKTERNVIYLDRICMAFHFRVSV